MYRWENKKWMNGFDRGRLIEMIETPPRSWDGAFRSLVLQDETR